MQTSDLMRAWAPSLASRVSTGARYEANSDGRGQTNGGRDDRRSDGSRSRSEKNADGFQKRGRGFCFWDAEKCFSALFEIAAAGPCLGRRASDKKRATEAAI